MRKIFPVVFLLLASLSLNAQTSRPIVTDISAKVVSTNKVKVSWKLSKDFKASSLVVYKSTRPIAARNQLYTIEPLGELPPKAISFTDTLKNYHDYYYAILAKTEDGSVYDIILPSINATVNPVKAPRPVKKIETDTESAKEKLYPAGVMRELPLPYLDMVQDIYRKPNKLSRKVLKAGNDLAGEYRAKPPKVLDPYYFEEDMVSPAGGDEYFLFEILKTSFIKKEYKTCAGELKKFLGVNRNQKVSDRAAFYLAECLYYTKNYRQAISLFLYVNDTYPSLSKKWIESCLELYEIPE